MMDGEQLLSYLDPRFLALLPAAALALKAGVDGLRKLWPSIEGGFVVAVTAVGAVLVSAVMAASAGIYADGADLRELGSTAVLAWMLMTGAAWVNEAGRKAARGIRRQRAKAESDNT